MKEFRAKYSVTKEELVLLDLPDNYLPQIDQLVGTTEGIYQLQSFIEVNLKPVSTTDANEPRTRLILSLKKVN